MTTITFAFVVATCLFFLFDRTRALGLIGVFVLLCINPLLFTGLLLLAGALPISFTEGETIMSYESHYLDAIETVLAWDLPDEALADAATEQARAIAGLATEDAGSDD